MGLAADFPNVGVFSLRMGIMVGRTVLESIRPFSINRRARGRTAPSSTIMFRVNLHISL